MTARLTAAQSALIAEHVAFAQRLAARARWRWPMIDPCLLTEWAEDGLIDAARQFDDTGQAKFTTYAQMRIWGRLLDGRRIHAGTRRRNWIVEEPFDHSAIDDHGVAMDPAIVSAACSLDLAFDAAERAIDASRVVDGLDLSERDRYVVVELGSGVSLREIGEALGVTESRVWQIRKAIYERNVAKIPA